MKPRKQAVGERAPIDFRQAQEDLRVNLRQGMLDAATRLLTEEGPSALTVRRVADAVNCSTTLLYSLFGGKDGLANELYLEGFARLKQEFAAANAQPAKGKDNKDGLAPLLQHARIYHQYAKRNPSYYMVMFGDAIAGFVPPVESRKKAWESLAALIDTFEQVMQSGALPPSNPTAAARLLWAAMHGAVSLELKGYYLKSERADELFDAAVNAVLRSLQMGPADSKETPSKR
ncbi:MULTISPECIES: TetR/AcrR family transcriptional regulator [Oxalobacteraceae]|jgi:AcrR family transcriptional regulator|uniref:TetR/AcrR family transcriptional regulator n=1 Tax=Oxalobacteraceae TaxID=75682 RepID=UPI0014560AA9|nr:MULTISPECIES: TetR/AcrR family transcriptional regulator [Oxalobacteraceae]